MQSYLFDKKTTINEKITVFKWRSRMENTFGENFRGGRDTVICKLCGSHTDSQEEGFKTCIFTKDLVNKSEHYENLFNEDIQSSFAKSLSKISNRRKELA